MKNVTLLVEVKMIDKENINVYNLSKEVEQMKRKIFLVILVLIITIVNLILFKNFYNAKISNNEVKANNYILENNI